jgi:hypothetical protein
MIYVKWLLLCLIDFALHLTLPFVPPVVALFTRAQPYDRRPYTWGGWWGTWDNPPQGDQGFVAKHAWFIGVTTGWRGYLNRVQWMWRNKLYGFAKLVSLSYSPDLQLSYIGNPNISDKYRTPGWYLAKLHYKKRLVGFEFYCVLPWSQNRNLRCRLGWKIMTDKFQRYGFAQLVNTCNPFDGYGESK